MWQCPHFFILLCFTASIFISRAGYFTQVFLGFIYGQNSNWYSHHSFHFFFSSSLILLPCLILKLSWGVSLGIKKNKLFYILIYLEPLNSFLLLTLKSGRIEKNEQCTLCVQWVISTRGFALWRTHFIVFMIHWATIFMINIKWEESMIYWVK